MKREQSVNRYAAELVGTFVLVLGGVGTAVLAGPTVGTLGVSLAFGLGLLAMVYVVGPISGCHLNPAVTLALVLTGKTPREYALGYVVAQIVGAIAAAAVVLLVVKGAPGAFDLQVTGLAANGFGAHSPGGYNLGAAFATEIVLTFVLVFTVLGATEVNAPVGFAGVAIGLVLALVHLIGIPVTNVSVNPARSIGPALFVGGWALAQLWLFVVAPLLGSALAAAVHRTLHRGAPQLPARDAERALPLEEAQRAGL
jgi:aquaporin Z